MDTNKLQIDLTDDKKDMSTTSSSSSSAGSSMTNGPEIGDKRTEGELQEVETGTTKARKVQTATSTSITSVEKVSTKRGQEVEIKANEDDELKLSDPLLGEELLTDWPADKLKIGMQRKWKA